MFVGVGSKRVRQLFAAAKKAVSKGDAGSRALYLYLAGFGPNLASHAQGKCIIFIDEIDAIGGNRQSGTERNHRMTLNMLLTEAGRKGTNIHPRVLIALPAQPVAWEDPSSCLPT